MMSYKIYIGIGVAALVLLSIFMFPATTYFLVQEDNEISILFVGDIMMDRSIRTRAEKVGYDFYYECVAPTFAQYDFVVANLESTVTMYPSVSVGKPQEDYNHFRFTIDPKALQAMKKAGINVVGVDNNHIYDYGKEGIELTREYVQDAGIYYFGDPINSDFSNLRLEKNGIAFNLVTFNEFFGSEKKTLNNIEKVENQDELIIIFSHWGDEYVETPQRVKDWAYNFINAGADVIIGMHPHITQKTEVYKEKFIAYSLGNFVFDQYFSNEVKKGMAVEVVLHKKGVISYKTMNVTLDTEKRPCVSK